MTDTIIKGTGNSRSIRSVPNLAALAPTYDALLALLTSENGLPVDIGQLNPAGCDVVGTANNKANLLSDATAALYGLGSDATVNKVLSTQNGKFLHCETGTYVGTSPSAGKKTSFSLIFAALPKIIHIIGVTYIWGSRPSERHWSHGIILVDSKKGFAVEENAWGSSDAGIWDVSVSGNTVYGNMDAYEMNLQNSTFQYIAFC